MAILAILGGTNGTYHQFTTGRLHIGEKKLSLYCTKFYESQYTAIELVIRNIFHRAIASYVMDMTDFTDLCYIIIIRENSAKI